jgi:hypothetical protein
MKLFFKFFLLVLCQLSVASTSNDSVFVSMQETDSSEIYILYHRMNDTLQKIYEINTVDGSSINYEYRYRDNIFDYDCISLWNNAAGCNQYIFLNRQTSVFYITKHCFDGFHIEKQSVSFKDRTLILYSDENIENITNISFSENFILYGYPIGKRVLEKIVILE